MCAYFSQRKCRCTGATHENICCDANDTPGRFGKYYKIRDDPKYGQISKISHDLRLKLF